MSDLILSPARVLEVEKTDRLFARNLDGYRRNFIRVLRRAPGYIASLVDQMQPGDLYRATIPKDVLKRLQQGEYEKVLKRSSGLWNGMIRKADGRTIIVKQTEWENVQLDQNSLA